MSRSWRISAVVPALAAASALLLAPACGEAPRPGAVAPDGRSAALDAAGDMCLATLGHGKHAAMAIDCAVCHACAGGIGLGPFTYPRGTSTEGGTIQPSTAASPATCAVACHYPLGTPPHPVTWDTPGPLACVSCHALSTLPPTHPAVESPSPTRGECEVCHDVSAHTGGTPQFNSHPAAWMDTGSAGFHAYSANQGLASCQTCHGQALAGGYAPVGCGDCHDASLPPGVPGWAVSCTMCHGGVDGPSGAPPRTTWGNGGDPVRVGAHTVHVAGGALGPPAACAVCHLEPADAFASGHIDARAVADVAFDGIATAGGTLSPSWDRGPATCSSVYCHGATLGGGTNRTPTWTRLGQGEAACGACHGTPPPAPHPTVSGGLPACSRCHAGTVDPDGNVIPPASGGLHSNGQVEGGGHDAAWMDTASAGFHAYQANRGLSPCQDCHGADLSGGTSGVGCAECHGPAWQTTCTMCHGGSLNATGAPPRATWGNAGDAIRIGAHTRHVAGGAIGRAFDCEECHAKPADALSAGHLDEPFAEVVFGPLATLGGAAPAWSRETASCSATYCHGNYSGTYTYDTWDWDLEQLVTVTVSYSGGNGTPSWVGNPMGCTSCHGNPTVGVGAWHSGFHGSGHNAGAGYNDCRYCHPDAATSGGVNVITDRTLHVNGVVDLAPQWTRDCLSCH
jgi:predicted CxxxxCH...CXXCH cytochrome family protein